MSLITRCPACETLFKVVPDQLRISDGWVRCGRCNEVFDASRHLLPDSVSETWPVVQDESSVPRFEAAVSIKTDSDSIAVSPDLEHLNSSIGLSNEQERPFSTTLQIGLNPVDVIPSPSAYSPSLPIDVAGSGSSQSTLERHDNDATEESDVLAQSEETSFLHQKNTNSFWDRSVVRTALVLIGSSLVLALCGQIVFRERDRIVTLYPKSRPWLQTFCRPLNCSLSPLRQIEFIAIDNSSFVKVGSLTYRLNLTLKNTGEIRLAVPAIEMTLTDSFDQPIVRRVFLPADLDARSNTLDVGTEWPTSVSLSVKAPGTASQITGYRLLAFYP